MELLFVFVAGLIFGLLLCLFCDWRSRIKPAIPGPDSSRPTVVEDSESLQNSAVSSGSDWQDMANDNNTDDPRQPPG